MAKGEIIISENKCCGCGLCEEFCNQGCIAMSADKFTPMGYVLPEVVAPDKCNACGFCGKMCPHYAIEVYKYITESEDSVAA